ncbi:MAG: glyoxylate reductase [Chloroflexota bacterium]|nr:glyoxylate reductase [Chloroflexota bacterium]
MPGPPHRAEGLTLADRVFATYPVPEPGLEILSAAFLVRVHPARPQPDREAMRAGAEGCRGMLTLVRDRVDAELLEALPELRAIANYGVGYDNIDIVEATRRGIVVTNTPDVLTAATADLAFALLLACTRRLGEGERLVRSGGFGGWDPQMLLGLELEGATLGLLGVGRIGLAVARRATGFGMKLLHVSRHESAEATALGSRRVELNELLDASDVVSIHVSLNDDTRHIIDASALRRMKPTAYLVNTARGPIVDEVALAQALREGWIAGAGLDVYEREPQVEPALLELDNVVLLPHLGSATTRARSEMARVAATNLVAALSGHRPPNPVNPEVLEK